MPIVTLPNDTTTLARYRFRVALAGVVFSLRFYFNRRADRWFMDIGNAEGTLLRAGIKLVASFPALRSWTQQGRPDGEILAIDPSGDVDARLGDLGRRVFVVFDDVNF